MDDPAVTSFREACAQQDLDLRHPRPQPAWLAFKTLAVVDLGASELDEDQLIFECGHSEHSYALDGPGYAVAFTRHTLRDDGTIACGFEFVFAPDDAFVDLADRRVRGRPGARARAWIERVEGLPELEAALMTVPAAAVAEHGWI